MFIKKDLYFAPKIKRSNIFQEDILEIKLGKKTRFVLLTMYKSCFKNIFRSKFQIKQIEGVIKEVFFLKGTVTTSVLSTCQMFVECADDPYVLENLQKCYVRIKTATKISNNQSRK